MIPHASVHALSGVASFVFILVRKGLFLAEADMLVQHCIAIHVIPVHGAVQEGAVQGQESDLIVLEGPFQLSFFWDSPSDESGTFLWRLNQHSSACLPLCLPSSPGQRVQTPSTDLFCRRTWGKSALCSHSNISAGKGGESSYRPPPGLRTIFWCLRWSGGLMSLFDGRGDTSQKTPMIWIRPCMPGSRRR